MGGAKNAWICEMERGWSDPRKFVCRACVGKEPHLQLLVHQHLGEDRCAYCKSKTRKAAPVASIMDAVLVGVTYHFNDEATAGAPCGHEDIKYLTSQDMLYHLMEREDFEWPEQLVADVARSLVVNGWIDAPEGAYMGSYHHEYLQWSWDSFARAVKHRSRFHFHTSRKPKYRGSDAVAVHDMLPYLGSLIRKHRLVRPLSSDTVLHRVRPGFHTLNVAELGPPSCQIARAGRMNPAGISYFYLAFDEATALAETRVTAGAEVSVSTWTPARQLHVIDLTRVQRFPSVFSGQHAQHDTVQFLYAFMDEVSKPVTPDDKEHLDYVPTQVVCEYISQVFRYSGNKTVDGLIYRSAAAPHGKNLVIFPDLERPRQQFDVMRLRGAFTGLVNAAIDPASKSQLAA